MKRNKYCYYGGNDGKEELLNTFKNNVSVLFVIMSVNISWNAINSPSISIANITWEYLSCYNWAAYWKRSFAWP